ncbi:hypothetical protein SDJN03_07964, partial [Cucurbita argyrosperma subsp. sororia]
MKYHTRQPAEKCDSNLKGMAKQGLADGCWRRWESKAIETIALHVRSKGIAETDSVRKSSVAVASAAGRVGYRR